MLPHHKKSQGRISVTLQGLARPPFCIGAGTPLGLQRKANDMDALLLVGPLLLMLAISASALRDDDETSAGGTQ